jgi:hypothetical protein
LFEVSLSLELQLKLYNKQKIKKMKNSEILELSTEELAARLGEEKGQSY